jgi:quercetin dioxygenase-like cupin family protein
MNVFAHTKLRRLYSVTIGLTCSALLATAAHAGSCPAGQLRDGATPQNDTPAKAVTDTVLTAIDLAKEPVAIPGRMLRLRKLTLASGGVVPWHSHANRPAIIYIVKGTVTEYASNCAVPIVHRAGEATPELHGVSHWWKNTGSTKAELLSTDFFPVDADPHAM